VIAKVEKISIAVT